MEGQWPRLDDETAAKRNHCSRLSNSSTRWYIHAEIGSLSSIQ